MAFTLAASGTTTTNGTEQTLASETTNGTYVFGIDTTNMALGDAIELRVYTKILSTSSLVLAYQATYANTQGSPNKYSLPFAIDNEIEITLQRVAGSDRSYDWELLLG